MTFKLPRLPFGSQHVSDWISHETLDVHHGRHHRGYVDRLNHLLQGSGLERASLEEVILRSEGTLLEQAAQAWNHTFYWYSVSEPRGGELARRTLQGQTLLARAVRDAFGGLDGFEHDFAEAAASVFGSGWLWLVWNPGSARLEVVQTSNAGNPIRGGLRPLVVCDVWEHAYYIDYRQDRAKYVEGFIQKINWAFVDRHLAQKRVFDATSLMSDALEREVAV